MIVLLIGMPATGKTSVVKEILSENPDWQVKKYKKLRFTISKLIKTVVFGVYPAYPTKIFLGTDMLTMDISRDAQSFLRKLREEHPDYSVLIEGDRFTNQPFLSFLRDKGYDFSVLELQVEEKEYKRRQFARNNMQSEQFIKRCETKIKNLRESFSVETFPNNDWDDSAALVKEVKKRLNIKTTVLRKNEDH